MTDVDILQLAAKDRLIVKYGSLVLHWSYETWVEKVNDSFCHVLDSGEEVEILNFYRRTS